MKNIILPTFIFLLTGLLFYSCEKELSNVADPQTAELTLRNNNKNKITICHLTNPNNNTFIEIEISQNAWPAHKAHGDKLPESFFADSDGDGFGDAAVFVEGCSAPPDYVTDDTDCNDTDDSIHPGATETCSDNIDNNCNGHIDEGCGPVTEVIIEGSGIEDAEVYSYYYRNWFNADWGGMTWATIGNYPSGLLRRAYFKFDLSGIPNTATIISANFDIFFYSWAHQCNTSEGVSFHRVEPKGSNGNWTEGTGYYPPYTGLTAQWPIMTWNNQDYITISETDVIQGSPMTHFPQTITYDLTSFVQEWVSGSWANYGTVVERDGAEPKCWQYFYTSESSYSPKLTVSYYE